QREHKLCISHERIDQYVYDDKWAGGTLYRHLRCQKQRRKRYGSHDRRGQLANRRCISERPAIVQQRSRLGDREADTIVGKGHQQALVSLTERKSKLTLLAKVEQATAEVIEAAIARLLGPLAQHVHTITSDNGREFARHQHIAATLEADFYFAHPYASWERGLNENTGHPLGRSGAPVFSQGQRLRQHYAGGSRAGDATAQPSPAQNPWLYHAASGIL
ncbi:MAG TPA: IS30 family transposase, partial [Abditibacteriaceae bacterium]|nr:IS30 family transposase [Abditibacteriaceae bacterium]